MFPCLGYVVLIFFFIVSVVNLALGYGLALYLGSPMTVDAQADSVEDAADALPSEEEIHALLNEESESEQAEETSSAQPQEPPQAPEMVLDSTVAEEKPSIEVAVDVAEEAPEESVSESTLAAEGPAANEAALEVAPETATPETATPESATPDIAAWQAQLLAEAEKSKIPTVDEEQPTAEVSASPELVAEAKPLPTRTRSVTEQHKTLADYVGKDIPQDNAGGAEAVQPEADQPEAEILAGIEAFRNQLAASVPDVMTSGEGEDEGGEANAIVETAKPQASGSDLGETEAVADNAAATFAVEDEALDADASEEPDAAPAQVQNVDADVMAGIDAFREQLAAMRSE